MYALNRFTHWPSSGSGWSMWSSGSRFSLQRCHMFAVNKFYTHAVSMCVLWIEYSFVCKGNLSRKLSFTSERRIPNIHENKKQKALRQSASWELNFPATELFITWTHCDVSQNYKKDSTFSPLGPADPSGPTGPGAPCWQETNVVGFIIALHNNLCSQVSGHISLNKLGRVLNLHSHIISLF